ncbi:redoxin domain-containing protein [Carboxylicivirga sp. N1Y90]|uniref:redoxin domain-containing protein n=1 Tax=Carboxylicivirga fragile TaxID=3417571 RepID=UPI003D343A0D|nr:AhpC/TSA family protein [Marinilabiliaceae bacterium N1Y90]
MRNIFILLMLSLLNFTSVIGQSEKQYYFELNGTINADTGTIKLFFFSEYVSNDLMELEAPIENNKFSFSGYITEPQGVSIFLDNRFSSSNFILDKGTQSITLVTDSSRKVPNVDNRIMTTDYPKYKEYFEELRTKWDKFKGKSDSLHVHYNYNIPNTINLNLKKEYDSLCIEDNEMLLKYCEKHPNSFFAFWRLVHLLSWGYEPIYDSIYNALSEEIKGGYAGTIVCKKLNDGKQLTVGEEFPLLKCKGLNNEPFNLDVFNKNSLTLVDFWFSRCQPCRAQFNKLRNLYQQYRTRGFEIVGISIDKDSNRKDLIDVIKKDKLVWKQYWDINGRETKQLSITAFPTNFLIDSKGVIIAKNISMDELEVTLNKSLQQER